MSNEAVTDLANYSQSLVDLVAKVAHGVVAVKAGAYRTASGVSLSEDLVAVSNHGLRREENVPVQTADGAKGTAKVLGHDASVDVAILKVEGISLKPLRACDPATLKPGMLAAVVGMTTDVGPSASLGMLGAVGPSRRMWRGGSLDQFLRLDANLYPSQFGAAVVDARGDLIGLATPALSRHAAIAVPVSDLRRVSEELAREGRIRHGYLGVGMQPVAIQASVASKLSTDAKSGLILLNVEPDSPAEKAGLQIGDILLELGGKRTSDIDELQASLRGDAIGKSLPALILRGGQVETVAVTVAERTPRKR
ncbi:MAG: S1C family serine protease [Acidobacteriota bacterium]|nr:S1C family serine protease [Acidobacteriota bacterium]